MKTYVRKVKVWLATTPSGTGFKVILGAFLGAIASWITTAEINPFIVALVSALVPIAINYLNNLDPRYGKGAGDGVAAD